MPTKISYNGYSDLELLRIICDRLDQQLQMGKESMQIGRERLAMARESHRLYQEQVKAAQPHPDWAKIDAQAVNQSSFGTPAGSLQQEVDERRYRWGMGLAKTVDEQRTIIEQLKQEISERQSGMKDQYRTIQQQRQEIHRLQQEVEGLKLDKDMLTYKVDVLGQKPGQPPADHPPTIHLRPESVSASSSSDLLSSGTDPSAGASASVPPVIKAQSSYDQCPTYRNGPVRGTSERCQRQRSHGGACMFGRPTNDALHPSQGPEPGISLQGAMKAAEVIINENTAAYRPLPTMDSPTALPTPRCDARYPFSLMQCARPKGHTGPHENGIKEWRNLDADKVMEAGPTIDARKTADPFSADLPGCYNLACILPISHEGKCKVNCHDHECLLDNPHEVPCKFA